MTKSPIKSAPAVTAAVIDVSIIDKDRPSIWRRVKTPDGTGTEHHMWASGQHIATAKEEYDGWRIYDLIKGVEICGFETLADAKGSMAACPGGDETIAHLKKVIAYSVANDVAQRADHNGERATWHVYISRSALHDWVLENRDDAVSEFIVKGRTGPATT
jgi:hypothetical protein